MHLVPSPIQESDDKSFKQDVLLAKDLVIVWFYAPWCGMCQSIGYMIESLQAAYGDLMQFRKMYTSKCSALVSLYNIRTVPSFYFFKNGELVDIIIGSAPRGTFELLIAKYTDVEP